MEQILDRFDAREEVYESHVIVNQGDTVGAGGEGEGAVAGRRCTKTASSSRGYSGCFEFGGKFMLAYPICSNATLTS